MSRPALAARIARFDAAVDRAVDRVRSPALDRIVYPLSSAADHSILWHAIGVTRSLRRGGDLAGAARFSAAIGIESAVTNGPVKMVFGRVRPVDLTEVEFRYGLRKPVTSSFPSGHATAAFCAATLLGGGVGWYTLAAAVAATRVYVRLHHASDVVAGAALGLVLGRGAWTHRARGHDGRDQEVPPMTQSFAVSFDYRCPFARNAQEAVVTGLREGRDWDVRFLAFSLDQIHVSEDEPPVWERPPAERGQRCARARVGHRRARRLPRPLPRRARRAVRGAPRQGRRSSRKRRCCARRSDRSSSTRMPSRPRSRAAARSPTLAAEHTEAVKQWAMFGVPTFVVGDRAVFVRLMERDRPEDIDQVLDLFAFERLNEFKYTRDPALG